MKTGMKMLMILTAVFAILCLSACSNIAKIPGYDVSVRPADSVESDDSSSETDSSNDSSGGDRSSAKKDLLQKFVDDTRAQAIVDVKAIAGDVFDFDMFVKGDAVVYSYKYKTAKKANIVVSILSESLEEQKSSFESDLSGMRLMGITSPVLVIEYLDANGDLVYSREFK